MKVGDHVEAGEQYTSEWDTGIVRGVRGSRVCVQWERADCTYWDDIEDVREFDGRRKAECDA